TGLALLLQLSVDDLIRYANGNFIIVYLLSMAAGVLLLRGLWRGVAALATLLCLVVLLALGTDALYALGLLAALSLWARWASRRCQRSGYPAPPGQTLDLAMRRIFND